MIKAYVQKKGGEWLNENCYLSATYLRKLGYEVQGFVKESETLVDPDPNFIFHGNVDVVRSRFEFIGVKQPEIFQPHTCLPDFTGRIIKESTVSQIDTYPIFIKPLHDHKAFTGKVVYSDNDMPFLEDDFKLLTSEVQNYISEYRCFVLDKSLIGCKHYNGSFRCLPDFNFVEEAILAFKDQPVAYSLDFGITDSGETQLIEINDAFSLGAYGLNGTLYARMIEARWFEITL